MNEKLQVEVERISALATRSCHGDLAIVDTELLQRKCRDAAANERRREIHILHEDHDAPLQRMLNALQPGSYVRPHRHLNPPKAEPIVILQGSIGYVPFHDDGQPDWERSIVLSRAEGLLAIDARAGLWHTFFALEPDTVVFEVKPGPYSRADDKDFAAWAPEESDDSAPSYLASLEDELRNRWGLVGRTWQ